MWVSKPTSCRVGGRRGGRGGLPQRRDFNPDLLQAAFALPLAVVNVLLWAVVRVDGVWSAKPQAPDTNRHGAGGADTWARTTIGPWHQRRDVSVALSCSRQFHLP